MIVKKEKTIFGFSGNCEKMKDKPISSNTFFRCNDSKRGTMFIVMGKLKEAQK